MVSVKSIGSRRSAGFFLGKILMLTVLAALGPACTKANVPPGIINGTPLVSSTNVGHMPLMVLKWDQAMNPATLQGNVLIYDNGTGAIIGGVPQIIYLPGTDEMVIVISAALAGVNAGTGFDGTYIIGGSPGITSASNQTIQALTALNIFTVAADTPQNVYFPSFSSVTPNTSLPIGPTLSGSINLHFTLAQDTTVSGTTTTVGPMLGNYLVWMATSAGGEDLLSTPLNVASGNAAGNATAAGYPTTDGLITITNLNPALTYYFYVVAIDQSNNVAIAAETVGIQPHP
jgi:hypothetical protein